MKKSILIYVVALLAGLSTTKAQIDTCNTPTSLSVVNISTSTAKLKWAEVLGATGYKVRYKLSNTAGWSLAKSADNEKTLSGLLPGNKYTWEVKSICSTLPVISSDWSGKEFFTTNAEKLQAIQDAELKVYPNPVSQLATVSFYLNEASPVAMEIIDVNGKSLREIAYMNFPEGSHEVTFDRESLIAGIYFLQLKTNAGVMMKKVVIE